MDEIVDIILETVCSSRKKIRNIRQYLRAVLFNAPSTIDSYYTALVAHDMAQPDWGKPKSSIPDYSYEGADSL